MNIENNKILIYLIKKKINFLYKKLLGFIS